MHGLAPAAGALAGGLLAQVEQDCSAGVTCARISECGVHGHYPPAHAHAHHLPWHVRQLCQDPQRGAHRIFAAAAAYALSRLSILCHRSAPMHTSTNRHACSTCGRVYTCSLRCDRTLVHVPDLHFQLERMCAALFHQQTCLQHMWACMQPNARACPNLHSQLE